MRGILVSSKSFDDQDVDRRGRSDTRARSIDGWDLPLNPILGDGKSASPLDDDSWFPRILCFKNLSHGSRLNV